MFFNKGIHTEFHVDSISGSNYSTYEVHLWGGPVAPQQIEARIMLWGGVKGQASIQPNGQFDIHLLVEAGQMNSLLYNVGKLNQDLGAFKTSKSRRKPIAQKG